MQSVSTLKRINSVFYFLSLFIFLLFINSKITAQAYVNGNMSTGAISSNNAMAPAGATWSEIQPGNTVAGYDANISSNHTVADDFTIPSGTWNLTKFTCYAYVPGYDGGSSPFNDIRVRIFNTDPSVGNPTPVFGDLTTNRFLSTYTFFIYRISNGIQALDKQLWKIEAAIPTSLSAGTYWIEWQLGSTEPQIYVPASTVVGTLTQPGNNAKTNVLPNSWANLVDAANPQDLPFRIDYNTGPCSGTPAPGNTLTTLTSTCPGVPATLTIQNPPDGSGITYQWQSSPDGITYSDIFMGNSDIYYGGGGDLYFRASVGCAGNQGFSNPVFVANTPSIHCYCIPEIISDCSAGDVITNVTIDALNNTSGCSANGYTNYGLNAGITVPILEPGTVMPISVTVGSSLSNKTVGVWIDIDKNGFYDNDYSFVGITTGGTLTATIGIPANAPLGFTKMRVRVVPNGPTDGSDVCLGSSFGETEDYIVDINPSTAPCSGIPAPGNTLSTVNPICVGGAYTVSVQNPGNGSGTTFQWQYSINGVLYYDIPGATGSYSSALGISSPTYFRCLLRCGGDTASSTPLLVQINDPANCYCIPAASDCSGGNEITNVTLGTLNNSSGCSSGGYTDYSTSSSVNIPDIAVGVPIPITISGGTPGAEIAVWIDYDHNGSLNGNTSEYKYIGIATGSPITTNINVAVPNTGYLGHTRMRVRMVSSGPMNNGACYNYAISETEDYMVNIVNCTNTISTQPQHAIICEGTDHTFTVVATGPVISYQWQQSTNGCGGVFTDIPGANNSTYTLVNYNTSQNYYAYWCVITGACNVFTSDCALTELPTLPSFYTQPNDVTVCDGGTAIFATYVWGAPLTFQWQVNTGSGWVDMPGDTSQLLTISPVTAAFSGNQYHLLAFGCSPTPVVSNTATLTVNGSPVISQQPLPVSVCVGSTAIFFVEAGGIGYTYQWQVSTDAGITFTNIPGATHDSLFINPVTSNMNGYLYQVIISGGGCTGTTVSTAATLSLSPVPVITQQPLPLTLCENEAVFFNVTASGTALTYQWQESTDGGTTFVNIPFAINTGVYIGPSLVTLSGNQYRVAVTGCGGTTYSNPALLTVNPHPSVSITANPAFTVLLTGQSTVLTASVSPAGTYTYSWMLNYVPIPGANSSTYTVNYGNPGTYTAYVIDLSANCPDTSNWIIVRDSVDGGRYAGQLYVYSNPSNGIFTVTYPDLPANSTIAVFDAQGFRMNISAEIRLNQPIRVNMSSAPAGVYILTINNAAGERLATGKVVIVH